MKGTNKSRKILIFYTTKLFSSFVIVQGRFSIDKSKVLLSSRTKMHDFKQTHDLCVTERERKEGKEKDKRM